MIVGWGLMPCLIYSHRRLITQPGPAFCTLRAAEGRVKTGREAEYEQINKSSGCFSESGEER